MVIPLYNNEQYISRCLESVINQDYPNFEIIVVDDGSTDNSLKICSNFKVDNIHIIQQENQGPSVARNTGIKYCSTESKYVFFVDSDDTIEQNYISAMIDSRRESSLVVSNYNRVPSHGKAESTQRNEIVTNSKMVCKPFVDEVFLTNFREGLFNPLWNKCYDLRIIRAHNLKIPLGFPEDIRFNLEYLKYCECVIILPHKLYNYILRGDSVTSHGYEEMYTLYTALQKRLYAIVPTKHHKYIDEFVYAQYLANTRAFIRHGDFTTPMRHLCNPYIKMAISNHRSTAIGDFALKYLLKYRLLWLLNKI